MHRTTVYLPDELRQQLKAAAEEEGVSQAEFVRAALRRAVRSRSDRRPRTGVAATGRPDLARDVDAALDRFGE